MVPRSSRRVIFLLFSLLLLWQTDAVCQQSVKSDQPVAKRRNRQELNRDLMEACDRHDSTAILSLLAQGADANARYPSRRIEWIDYSTGHPIRKKGYVRQSTALLLALAQEPPDLIKLRYLDSDISKLLPPSLHRIEVVKALLSRGARVNDMDDRGRTPLMMACLNCDIEMVELLLAHKAKDNVIDIDGMTPLLCAACMRGAPNWGAVVKLLLEHGADVNLHPQSLGGGTGGGTALGYADYDTVLTKMLKDAGAKE